METWDQPAIKYAVYRSVEVRLQMFEKTAVNFDETGLFYDKSTELAIKILYLVLCYTILIGKGT